MGKEDEIKSINIKNKNKRPATVTPGQEGNNINNNNNNNNNNNTNTNTNNNKKKKNKKNEVAIFGNYKFYYGYRVGKGDDEDERLNLLKKEYFENKDCLDIGCNSGVLTIEIAKKFGCKSMLGIDIDGDRVRDAFWNLRRTVRMTNAKNSLTCSNSIGTEMVNGVQPTITGLQKEDTTGSKKTNFVSEEKDLFGIVTFEEGNFVQDWRSPENKRYHTILCLSVSKWIHLNWGDDGLITLFSKIWKHLHPGGIFILEPQPWESYTNNRLVCEVTKKNYLDINIYPDSFQEILLDKIGFRKVENITSSLLRTKAGFARPILAFWK